MDLFIHGIYIRDDTILRLIPQSVKNNHKKGKTLSYNTYVFIRLKLDIID